MDVNDRSTPASRANGLQLDTLAALVWRQLGWKVRLAIVAPLLLAGSLLLAVGGGLAYYTLALPDPHLLAQRQRPPALRILARDGGALADRGASYQYMPLALLPKHVVGAVVATEDRRFFQHIGIDLAGLARAALANVRAGRYAQGGSTLTQQLAKNLFLRPERTLARKVEELLLALWLEARIGKQEILEIYLNRVYFGGGAYGIETASQRFFGKSASALSIAEAAVIAGILKAPSRYAPSSNPGQARMRGRSVLLKMQAAGIIGSDETRHAMRQSVVFSATDLKKSSSGVEYAIDLVLERLPAVVGGGGGDIIVDTTIDANVQRLAQAIVERAMTRVGPASQAAQAAAVLLDPEGGIRALIGGASYSASPFDRALKARRQPGSTFKPFVYLAALERGLTPDSISLDHPITIDGWSPRNESGSYRGPVTLREALAQSINSVAVRLYHETGPLKVIEVAHRLGIHSELRNEPSLALGTSEVTLLELTAAYTTFANGGSRVEPHIIERVRTSEGRVLFEHKAPPNAARRVLSLSTVGRMNDMLNATLVSGTGRRAAIPHHPAAGKTGTSQDFRDAWFIGYTAQFTGGVWIGNDKGQTMNKVMGGGLPARIWREIMLLAHEGRAPLPLPGTVIAEQPSPATRLPQPIPPRLPREGIDPQLLARVLGDEDVSPAGHTRSVSGRDASQTQGWLGKVLKALGKS